KGNRRRPNCERSRTAFHSSLASTRRPLMRIVLVLRAMRVADRSERSFKAEHFEHGEERSERERRGVMTILRGLLSLILAVALARTVVAAAEPDAEVIAKITGVKPDVKNGIAKMSVPRGDLGAVIDGTAMQPFQGLTSWAAFQAAGDK